MLNRKTADQVFGLINMIVIILHVWGPADKLSSSSSTADKLEMDIDLFRTKIEPTLQSTKMFDSDCRLREL